MSRTHPVLKWLHSPDALDLESFRPDDPECFCLLLQAMFGPEDETGEESFDILVCTPRWIEREVEKRGILNGRHHLIVSRFDLGRVRAYLDEYGSSCASETWQEATLKLSRLGRWEFEDYQKHWRHR